MKSITVHNIDSLTIQKIEAISKESGKSLNKVIKELLNKSLGIDESKKEFGEFVGIWSDQEYADFQNEMDSFNTLC